jgi:hypothetical protein
MPPRMDTDELYYARQQERAMIQTRKITYSLILLAACLALLASLGRSAWADTEGIPFVWQGTVNSAQTRMAAPRGSGSVTDRWVLTVRWREGQRIEVKDSDGSLVGWFVKLEDAGSFWQSDTTGGYEITCPRGGTETREEFGGDSGAGDVFTPGWGWIYYSASDDDPLAEVLPNGSYAFSNTTKSTQEYTVDWIRHGCPDSMGKIDVTESTRPAYLHYKVGGRYMFEPFAAPGGFKAAYLPVQAVRAMAAQRMKVPSAFPWDSQGRAIKDSRMKGSAQNAFHGAFSNTLSWDITRVLDLQPEIEKCSESWRPVGEGSAQGDEEVSIQASVPKYPEVEGKWRFTLSEVSKEKGYCLNAGDDTGFDLEFKRGQEGFEEPEATGDGERIEGTETVNQTAVKIKSKDYGAWAKLKAEINVDGVWYLAQAADGMPYVTLPRDDDENRISDNWEKQEEVSGQEATADEDNRPDGVGREPGDGFSNYEEYRGFVINGKWQTTDPTWKDLFIRDEIGLGIGWLSELLLAVHLVDEGEMDSSNMVTFNRGFGKVAGQDGQKGILLRQEDLESGVAGECRPWPGCPNAVDEVVIDSFDSGKTDEEERRAYAEGLFTYSDLYLAGTIAHELGHALNILHHGFIWEEFGADCDVAYLGGLWSGDLTCVMRYHAPSYYTHGGGTKWDYPTEGVSKNRFCESPAGTGINAAGATDSEGRPRPVAGDAQEGACRKKVTLKGWHQLGN